MRMKTNAHVCQNMVQKQTNQRKNKQTLMLQCHQGDILASVNEKKLKRFRLKLEHDKMREQLQLAAVSQTFLRVAEKRKT